jgi:hypothetical protein
VKKFFLATSIGLGRGTSALSGRECEFAHYWGAPILLAVAASSSHKPRQTDSLIYGAAPRARGLEETFAGGRGPRERELSCRKQNFVICDQTESPKEKDDAQIAGRANAFSILTE